MSPFLIVPTDNGDLTLSTFRAITGYVEAQVYVSTINVLLVTMTTG